jgi:hypothetical protein
MSIISSQCSVIWAGTTTGPALGNPPQGVTDPIVLITLVPLNGSFPEHGYYAVEVAKNQILEVALTAVNTQSTVLAWFDEPTGAAGQVLQCYGLTVMGLG